jgi:hydrogenase maturation protein HypF
LEESEGLVARRIDIEGIVQGVGFRPFVHRLATELGLSGEVSNHTGGVTVIVEGPAEAVDRFAAELPRQAPPIARIDAIRSEDTQVRSLAGFEITASERTGRGAIRVPPDIATCPDCHRELRDPADRRYGHPFINCTNCGPRFTIVRRLPYDRPQTSMAGFPMCDRCRGEYEDITDRRYHAQPVACTECGPSLGYRPQSDLDPLDAARRDLAAGKVVAIKGIGGFHLACDARSSEAVARLRARKRRELKPLAVMFRDLGAAREHAEIPAEAAELLIGPRAPIVLLPRLPGCRLAPEVAPDTDSIGVMLPYTPVHALLFDGLATDALVMTSGNLSDEPICTDSDDALDRLGTVADGFLLHDREIVTGCDDSVIRWTDVGPLMMRRSRGYVPFPTRFPAELAPVLAVGGHLKNVFCMTRGQDAYPSQHIGDLEDEGVLAYFERQVSHLESLLEVRPEAIACDLHPDYLSTRWAEERAEALGVPLIRIQHHYAHGAAVLAEHGIEEPALVIAADGTGLGTDGTVWGCELLRIDGAEWERVGHLRPIRLAGGDVAARETWRPCLAWLEAALGELSRDDLPEHLHHHLLSWPVIQGAMRMGINSPVATSAGRLFDAVACLLDVAQENAYEGQAPMRLEALAADTDYPMDWDLGQEKDAVVLDPTPALRAMLEGLSGGVDAATLAGAFHGSFAEALVRGASQMCRDQGLHHVGLTGGTFQNARLLRQVVAGIRREGLTPLWPRESPPGDGGLALGQAVAASLALGAGRPS